MLTFTIIILICILALGVSLLASHWNSGAKSGEAIKIETLYKKNWRSFFWISLRVLSFALVTAFLFLMLLASFAGDDAAECCFFINDICYWKLVYFNTYSCYLYLLSSASHSAS